MLREFWENYFRYPKTAKGIWKHNIKVFQNSGKCHCIWRLFLFSSPSFYSPLIVSSISLKKRELSYIMLQVIAYPPTNFHFVTLHLVALKLSGNKTPNEPTRFFTFLFTLSTGHKNRVKSLVIAGALF